MKAITLWQPWASLVACGAKTHETRSWGTSHRGPLAIHSAKRFDEEQTAICFRSAFREALKAAGFSRASELPLGCVIAVCDLVDVVQTEVIRGRLSDQEREFGDYTTGRFAWRLENIQPVGPFAARGFQQLWEWDETEAGVVVAVSRPFQASLFDGGAR